MSKIQPWQSLFMILSYAVGVYGLDSDRALVLYGMILAALGFVQLTTYKHKQAVKEVVAPWLVEQLLKTLSEYLEKPIPTPSDPDMLVKTPEIEVEASSKEIKAKLKAQIAALEAVQKNGTSNGR